MRPYANRRLLRDRTCNRHGKKCGIFVEISRYGGWYAYGKNAKRRKRMMDKKGMRRLLKEGVGE